MKEEENIVTEVQKEKKKGGCAKTVGIILLILTVIYGINTIISNQLKKETDQYLKEYSEKERAISDIEMATNLTNSQLPMENDGLILYKIEYLKEENIQRWHYQFDIEKSEMDNEAVLAYKENAKNAFLLTAKNSSDNKSFITVGVTFVYVFEDKNGDEIFEIKITPEEYK